MEYEYYICDVFTGTPFGGNQLAVLPDAVGLTDQQMQQIAREFNFSETSFVFPPEKGFTKKVRINTPVREIPFAGHPNVGTAYVLAVTGAFGEIRPSMQVIFEEKAGLVEINITRQENGFLYCELKAPEQFSTGIRIPAEMVANALSVDPEDILVKHHEPQLASVGLPFVITEVRDPDTLKKIKPTPGGFQQIAAYGISPSIHIYTKSEDEFDIRARMFAPMSGVPEDPATGSANCALGGLLAALSTEKSGQFTYKIAQGFEMGRPSVLYSRAAKENGEVIATWIGGEAVITCKGTIYFD
jgi:trans-2,3-dihydro-3-hydroxyanthranilate isomerase